MNKRASRFCFNIEDFRRVICQPKSWVQLLSVENKHKELFLSILWDQIMNKHTPAVFLLGMQKTVYKNMLISIAECFHYGQFLVKVFGYHSCSVDLLVTTAWWTHTYLNKQELWNTASEAEQEETWQHSKTG